VLHGEDGKQAAAKALKLIKTHVPDVLGQALGLLLDVEWPALQAPLREGLEAAAHLVLVFSPSLTESPWLPFFLGFSLGRGVPVLGYGASADKIPEAFSNRIIPFKGDADFKTYLAREAPLWAAGEYRQEARTALLDQGIPVTDKAFENCIKDRNLQAVNLFLRAGFPPDAHDAAGVPLLCLAVRTGDRDTVNTLLKAGADVNARSKDRGGSALIDSALGKYDDIGADLLAAGAEVNVKSKDGQSALIIAVGLNDTVFAEMLLRSGANPDDPDALGASARKYASLFNKPAIMKLFEKYAAQ
jgi:ankyrin repeat protein